MAILSNINGKFAVDSTGAIQLSGSAGTANYVLVSGGAAAAPTWVAGSTVIGGPYLPLSGGTLTGATATSTGISFTVGGNLTVTGAATYGVIITTSGTQDTIKIDRAANTDNAITKYQTASTDKWIVGLRNTSDDNFRFYSYGTASDVLTINQADATATFAGTIYIPQSAGAIQGTAYPGTTYIGSNTDATTTYLQAGSTSGYKQEIKLVGGNTGYTTFSTQSAERMRITSDGQFLMTRTGQPPITNSLYGTMVLQTNADTNFLRIRFDVGTTPYWGLTKLNTGNFAITGLIASTWNDHVFEIEQTTGDVGIGAAPTQAKLCISGTQNSIYLTRGGVSDTEWTISSDSVSMYIGEAVGGNIMTLREDGHVGIGTTGPSSPLHVAAAPANGTYLSYLYNSATHNSANGLNVQTSSNNILTYGLRVNTAGDSNALAVMGNGSVGIGTGSPASKLQVEGAVFANGEGNGFMLDSATATTARTGFMKYAGTEGQIISGSGTKIRLTHRTDSAYVYGGTPTIREDLVIDTAGNVGIGETNPKAPGGAGATTLTLKGTNYPQWISVATAATTNSTTWRSISRNSHLYQIQTVNDAITSEQTAYEISRVAGSNSISYQRWFAGTTEAMRIDSSGNVGIGTTAPGAKLQVQGNIGFGDANTQSYNGGSFVNSSSTAIDTNWGIEVQHTSGGVDYNTRLKYYPVSGQSRKAGIYNAQTNTFSLYSDTNNNPNIIIPDGNVGIGVTSPAAKLHVKGGDISVEETGGNGNKIFLTTDHNSHYINANAYWVDVIGNANEVFRVFGGVSTTTEFLRVTGSGYTKLTNNGDTTWQGYNFHAITQSAASEPTVMIYNSASTGNQYGVNVIHKSTSANTTGRFFLGATNNGATENIKIYTNGNIQNTNNSYTQLSDSRLKENIVDATSKLEEIKRLRVVNWNFIGDDLKQIGMVAQEVEEIFPGLVDVTGDNQIIHGTTYENVKSLKYSVLVPILVKAIQELEARVKELENK